MAVSNTLIANKALIKLGEARITDLSDETKPARTLNTLFESVRDEELRANRWKFAKARAELAADADAPDFGYSYQYTLPTDFLRLDTVGEAWPRDLSDYRTSIDSDLYALEDNKILTDIEAPLKIRYGKKITDPTQFDALFVEALACRLAMEACEEITQSNSKFDRVQGQYMLALRRAIRSNAMEKPPQYLADDSWILGRL